MVILISWNIKIKAFFVYISDAMAVIINITIYSSFVMLTEPHVGSRSSTIVRIDPIRFLLKFCKS